ncbi:uncharacterized protein DUF1615 [Fluviicoccus keumensis]|uniref:Uncharacterized protein DUF1615 n=1 Tax=Fluviicoccus keumensis TaxID=1435465 RepID=A0A4Q7Z4P8_9GAMM|nr:DUF1615 domain-containing protein [Fluviicoccus keumensis]RZU45330.1 uncharacterized protein DUF1615 [Fluviicoccus keumensis]
MKPIPSLPALVVLSVTLSACVSTPSVTPAPIPVRPTPAQPANAVSAPATPVSPTPAAATETPPSSETVFLPPLVPPVVVPTPPGLSEAEARALLTQLLPTGIKDRNGWRNDILSAFTALKIPYEAPYFCAALSIIEQESSWQADPGVPGLDKIVWKEIEKRAAKYHVPLLAVKAAFLKSSPDGRSYKARVDALRTEKEMNDLFEDMAADAQKLHLPLGLKNPIRTGGPMQVSVEFAEGHVRVWPYPYSHKDSIRSEVFSRRGGVYFGIAMLLQYRVNYPDMSYRFADYNAGRYSSRNAAFQAAVGKLAREKMVLDGDLLMYESRETSNTQKQLLKLASRLNLSEAAIERDLRLEKTEGFSQTPLYRRVFEAASAQAGRPLPQAVMPQIRLSSPKITRKLTTEWFAKRVDGRYQKCLARLPD